ncbi:MULTISPECIES: helix-turn-helix domain-containing protein [Amycolatopsis]|uniref:helix-turn-helix domain-containing protein n=1 Tax=Amycolatopsis TaxID=1813 RepID=UPI000B8ABA2F|nr:MULTISPECIES: helix-turn-helix domain-containing protein [Amycolatopsis]OXM65568.1 AraC family transcriptional regulator [Amycolatopsis sp. KNN50.9b]
MTAEWVVRAPHPQLRPAITRYIGYTQHGVTLETHRGLPSRHVTLVISLAEPIRFTGLPRPGQSPGRYTAALGGMHTAPALIAQDAFQSGVHVEIDPLATPALFGVPATELSNLVVDLAELGPKHLAERLADAPTWAHRFAILDDVFRPARADREPAREVAWAWRRLTAAGGLIRVEDLAAEVGWSRRHFAERFRRELGLPPKQAARVLRFERAIARLRQAPTDLATLAADCGFYDQAHLSNEWRALAGCSPRTWIAEELPFLQDQDASAGPDSGT